jgi:hypothetical protein
MPWAMDGQQRHCVVAYCGAITHTIDENWLATRQLPVPTTEYWEHRLNPASIHLPCEWLMLV